MDRAHSHEKFSGKMKTKQKKAATKVTTRDFPEVLFDKDSDFASIKLEAGIEAKSYLKDGVLFSENAEGRVIEVQILNVSLTTSRPRSKNPRKAG